MSRGILDGVRVLDLTNVLAGPFCTMHLALMGAEVIKIENPKDGDLARKLGILPELNEKLMGTSFLAQNANKKSVTLNTKSPEGKELFKELVKTADVLVENFRPDVMKRDSATTSSGRSTRAWCTAPSPASGRRGRTRSSRPTTRSSRA